VKKKKKNPFEGKMAHNILDVAQEQTMGFRSGIYTGAPKDPAREGNVTAQFPLKLDASDPRDELMRMKQQFLEKAGAGATTKFGVLHAEDADFEWLKRKKATEITANFQHWVTENFHTNDVVKRKWLQEIFPEYYDEREKEMLQKTKLAMRVKLILFRGPKNEKDLVLMFAIAKGLVKLDRDWDRVGPSLNAVDDKEEQKRFRANLLNPARFLTDPERKVNQELGNNPFKPQNASDLGKKFKFSEAAEAGSKVYPDFLQNVLSPYL
jgi:hypothetical protein